MVGIHLDLLLFMHSLNAVGLMPDEEYELQRERLTSLIANSKWTSEAIVDGDLVYQEHGFDWRIIITDFLNRIVDLATSRETYNMLDGPLDDSLEATFDEFPNFKIFDSDAQLARVRAIEDGPLSHLSFVTMEVAALRRSEYSMRNEIIELRRQLTSLKSDIIDSQNASPASSVSAPSERFKHTANSTQIRDLQEQMARCLKFAAMYDAKGDSYAAGSHRGEAARLESKLRALGA